MKININIILILTQVQTYTTTYPIYSSYPSVIHRTIPYAEHDHYVTRTRISPTRIIRSPPRVIATPVRIVSRSSPVRFIRTPIRVVSSPGRVVSVTRTRPSLFNREIQRIENRARTHPHYYATEHYLNSSDAKVGLQ